MLPGGTIKVSGNIVAESGSMLDVSGTSDVLDVAPGYLGTITLRRTSGSILVPTRIDSDGGSIVLAGSQELVSEATLKGSAGGPTAMGGSLTVSSGRFYSLEGATQNSARYDAGCIATGFGFVHFVLSGGRNSDWSSGIGQQWPADSRLRPFFRRQFSGGRLRFADLEGNSSILRSGHRSRRIG